MAVVVVLLRPFVHTRLVVIAFELASDVRPSSVTAVPIHPILLLSTTIVHHRTLKGSKVKLKNLMRFMCVHNNPLRKIIIILHSRTHQSSGIAIAAPTQPRVKSSQVCTSIWLRASGCCAVCCVCVFSLDRTSHRVRFLQNDFDYICFCFCCLVRRDS